MPQQYDSNRGHREGAVAIEFALVFPIFLFCVLGIVEIGRGIMIHQILTNGAREGARRAIIPGATDTQVYQIIDSYMAGTNINSPSLVRQIKDSNGNPLSLTNASSHQALLVTVSVPYGEVNWGIVNWIAPDAQMSATVTMRKE